MVIITDCEYRSSIAAIYSLVEMKEDFVLVTTDKNKSVPAFHSKYANEKYTLPSGANEYKDALFNLCKKYKRPVILPIGVFTLNILSENIDSFNEVADFCIAKKEILDTVNNKIKIKEIAIKSNVLVPDVTNHDFPLVIKPLCGEKLGLKASERYKIVHNYDEYKEASEHFSKFSAIITEKYIKGNGIGVSVVIGKDKKPYSAFCHKRLSEYPCSGGPSTSLITFKNDALINDTINLLNNAQFQGIAMAEYKESNGSYYLLEVNPRIWGSFPATFKAKSDFLKGYLNASRGIEATVCANYKTNKKVKFLPNIFASVFSYAKNGYTKKFFMTFLDALNIFIPNAVFSVKDPLPSIFDLLRKRR